MPGTARRGNDPIGRALRTLKPGEYVVISKRIMPELPPSYEETQLGTPPSAVDSHAIRQFRGPYRRHVYETPSSWIAHKDYADPRRDPLDHIIRDIPEIAAGLVVGGLAGYAVGSATRTRRLAEGATEEVANRDAVLSGLLSGLLAGGATYLLVSVLRRSR